ncbi:MAG: hypothetical protein JW944_10410, partial [Deltaproteobacteria bacterium]|nr:hypothetical protein [Deltaproteobacteria bacterium]
SCHKAGDIEIGMQVEEVYQIVGNDNTKLTDLFREDMFEPVMEIYYEGIQSSRKPSLVAEISPPGPLIHTYTIGRINVYDQKFSTKEGIGVGSTLGDLKKLYKVDQIGYGEGTVYALVESLCMSFELPSKWYGVRNPDGTAGPNLIPDTEKIIAVLIH